MLTNHGRQVVVESEQFSEGGWRGRIDWRNEAGRFVAAEHRTITSRVLDPGWVLSWRSHLLPMERMTIGSPATNGRPGAFYGGLFWRAPGGAADVTVAEGVGVEAAHGSTSPWIGIVMAEATLVARQTGPVRPWFVRSGQYLGFGPALAVDERLVVTPEAPLDEGIDVAIADGRMGQRDIESVAQMLAHRPSLRGGAGSDRVFGLRW